MSDDSLTGVGDAGALSQEGEEAKIPTALIVEALAEERAVLFDLIQRGRAVNVVKADSIEAAAAWAVEADSLALFVIGVEASDPELAFELRDALIGRFGATLQGAFCGGTKLESCLDRVDGEMVFLKPVDSEVMKDWLSERLGPAESSSVETETEAATETAFDEVDTPLESEISEDEARSLSSQQAADNAEDEGSSIDPEVLPEGTELGDYRIARVLRSDNTAAMYVAEQRSISRTVALKALHHRHRTDPEKVGAFVDEARSRALISHTDVALVYEADQQNGITYYAIELMSGPNLATLAEEGATITEDSLFDVLGSVSDVLLYLKEANVGVVPIRAAMIHLPNRESCRIANPVVGSGPFELDEADQMKRLGAAIRPFLSRNSFLMPLVQKMGIAGRSDAILCAEDLIDALDELEAAGIAEPQTPKQVERRADQRSMVVGGVIGGLIVVAGLAFLLVSSKDAQKKDRVANYMVPVPAGSFVYQDSETIEMPQFWIDEYEVTIAQYAEFLEAIDSDTALLKKVDHANQPASKKTHQPPDWDRYYPVAKRSGTFGGAAIDLKCPVIQVDWWDAHAYASWRGGRLPSEQEWEKAARSRSGNLFPWGNELDSTRFNSGVDQKVDGEVAAGSIDGFQYWNPVDAISGDQSSYGVGGMGGNVSEWTGTWETDPDFPDRKVPIIRGASFSSRDNFDLKRRVPAQTAETVSLATGFRIVRDTAPPVEREGAEGEG